MAKTKKFSKHITWKEATGSATAKKLDIDNTPNDEQLSNMKIIAELSINLLLKKPNDSL